MTTNRTLALVFLALLAVYAVLALWPGRGGDRSFRQDLIVLDTAAVTALTLYPKTEPRTPVRFTRSDNGWTISQGDHTAEAAAGTVRRMLGHLTRLEATRLAANRSDRWAELAVTDSLATRVVAETDAGPVADVLLGRLSVPQGSPQDAATYVRLSGEDEVYATPGLLAFDFDGSFDTWRNRTVVRLDPGALTRIAVTAPADSGFTLARTDAGWTLDGEPADSMAVARYLGALRTVTATEFAAPGAVPAGPPRFSASFADAGMTLATVEAFPRPGTTGYFLRSSQNPTALFIVPDSTGAFPRIFAPRRQFVP